MRTLAAIVLVFPLAAATILAAAGWGRVTAWLGPLSAAAVIGSGAALAAEVLAHGPLTAAVGLIRVDALSAFMVIVIGVVVLIASSYGVGYIADELDHRQTDARGARAYGVLVQVFVAAMLAAVLTDNLGVLWVAVEATTIATAFLVGHRRSRASLEASWKYVVIGSVGVALAFLGTVLVYFASRHAGGATGATLQWSILIEQAAGLDPGVMRLAIGLIVLGYGTKVGLAPMHTWLPDAHSQAPAPVSALMSGVLLSVAMYALMRYKVIADVALGGAYLRGLLASVALLSVVVSASLLLAQRDYKRLLAYSSIEHMGLVALGVAIGTPLAVAAALLHVLGHGMSKAVLFCASGEILASDGTTRIAGVRGLLAARPLVGGVFAAGLLAVLGFPPFSLFASELAIVRAGVAAGIGWVVALALVLTFVVFSAVIARTQQMLLGEPAASSPRRGPPVVTAVTLVSGLVGVAVLGVSIRPIERLLHAAAQVVAG